MQARTRTQAYTLLTLTALFWSSNMILGRGLRTEVPPITLAFWRWVVALMAITPFAYPHLKVQWPIVQKNAGVLIFLGLLGVAGYNTFAYIALQYTQATNAAMLNSFIPIATILLSWVLLGKKLKPLATAGVLISLFGVLTLVSHGQFSHLRALAFNQGDVWMMVAVLTWGLYTVGLNWRPSNIHPLVLMFALTCVGLLALLPAYVWEASTEPHRHLSTRTVLGVLYTGIVPGVIGNVFYNAGVAKVGANQGALFIHLMPVFGTLLAMFFLNETPQLFHGVGMVLILSGIALTLRR